MFNAESLFLIGDSHSVCEDYARDTYINLGEPIPVIAVADGCSSERDTDMGSRFLCYAATKVLREMYTMNYTHQELGDAIIEEADEMAGMLGTVPGSMYSTLLLAYPKDGKMCVHMWGDGTFILNGESYTIEYSGNAPYYLRYTNRKSLHDLTVLDNQTVKRTETNEDVDPLNLYWEFDINDVDSLVLSTDGICSFMNESGDFPMERVVEELVAFKNRNRGFLVRRVQRLLKNFEKDNDIFIHYDDWGIAAFIKE